MLLIEEIMELLPHRPPFLLIDRVLEVSESHAIASKNVTINESFFAGHFPLRPVMPGVLIIEAIAQTAAIVALKKNSNPSKKLLYLTSVEKASFKKMVVPGDVMIIKVTKIYERMGLCKMQGYVSVNGEMAVEAQVAAMLMDRK